MARDIRGEIRKLIGEHFDTEVVTDDTLLEALGADSFSRFELVLAFEDTFDVDISDEDAASMKTVADTMNYVEQKLQEQSDQDSRQRTASAGP